MTSWLNICAVALGLLSLAPAAIAADDVDVTGPFKVVMEEDASLPNHTIFRPADLSRLPPKSLPIVVWGNGACGNAGNAFERYLAEIASHGFLVIANGPIDHSTSPFGRPPRPGEPFPPFPPGGLPPPASSAQQMLDAVTWAQSGAASRYAGRIDKDHVAVAGQSCGGLQALIAAADPRVTTAVIVNSGVLRKLPPGLSAAPMNLPTPDLKRLHVPMIYLIGGPTDIAFENANGDFDELSGVPVFRADLDVGHNGTLWQPHGGRFAEAATAWLQWRLKGDAAAGRQFVGSECGLCRTSGWTVRRKEMDALAP